MLPSLIGIIASSGGAVGGDYESIATVTVGSGGASSVTFSSIPSTYQHLQIRAIGRCTPAAAADSLYQFNGDTAGNYALHLLVGNGATAACYNATSQTSLKASPYLSGTSNIFGAGITDILDYANTNKYKTIRTLTGVDNNTSSNAEIQFFSGLWQSTAAITSITITPNVSSTYAEYSSFALYGIKG